jgi:predicted GIY-YIG superfamily endonuclease
LSAGTTVAARLLYFEEFDDINQAIARESKSKQMPRSTRIGLIEPTNPAGRDLSAE